MEGPTARTRARIADVRCGTCRWFGADEMPGVTDGPDDIAPCRWLKSNPIPYALRYAPREGLWVGPQDGRQCPCWVIESETA